MPRNLPKWLRAVVAGLFVTNFYVLTVGKSRVHHEPSGVRHELSTVDPVDARLQLVDRAEQQASRSRVTLPDSGMAQQAAHRAHIPKPATARPRPVAPQSATSSHDDAFWRSVANCECASGHCRGGFIGWFQFSPDTAAKVGIDGSEPYEEQLAAAKRWAAMIHPREGSKSGWPRCWWRAGG